MSQEPGQPLAFENAAELAGTPELQVGPSAKWGDRSDAKARHPLALLNPLMRPGNVGRAIAGSYLLVALLGCSDSLSKDPDSSASARDAGNSIHDSGLGSVDSGEHDADSGVEADSLSVVSLNLRCLIDDWEQRRPIIVAALANIDPDLMGFQEVCAEVGAKDNLVELLSDLSARTGRPYTIERAVTHRAWDRYNEGIAVATTAQNIADVSVVNLPQGTFPRKAIFARIGSLEGTVVFGTTHLDHQSDLARQAQVAALVAGIDDFVDINEPIVLTGDFNEAPDVGAVHRTLKMSFIDVWESLRPYETGYTFPATNPSQRIDYVWLRSAASDLDPKTIELIVTDSVDGIMGSDHLGLSATLLRP